MIMATPIAKHDDRRLQMIPAGQGCWLTVQRLPAGSFRFRYLADARRSANRPIFGIEAEPPLPLRGRAA
jgi:hypothetical protein